MTLLLRILQWLAVFSQASTELVALIPEKYHPIFHTSVAISQGIFHEIQKYYNSDGARENLLKINSIK